MKATPAKRLDLKEQILQNVDLTRNTTQDFSSVYKTNANKQLIKYQIKLRSPEPLKISQRKLNATFNVDLHLQGFDDKPITSGNIQILDGWFKYKNQFHIDRGQASFSGKPDNVPTLDIIASATISPYVAKKCIFLVKAAFPRLR